MQTPPFPQKKIEEGDVCRQTKQLSPALYHLRKHYTISARTHKTVILALEFSLF